MNYKHDAGWSSPVARQAHNLKVVGSNPTPATNYINKINDLDHPQRLRFLGFFLRFKPDKGLFIPTTIPTSRQVYSIFYNETVLIAGGARYFRQSPVYDLAIK